MFTYSGELSGTPKGGAPNFLDRSYTITAEVEIPQGGAEGMLVTDGGRFGGNGFYLLKGKPVFVYNYVDMERFRWEGKEALAPGKHTLVFDFEYDGIGFGQGRHRRPEGGRQGGRLARRSRRPCRSSCPKDETFDVGVDTRTPVDDRDYQVPFRFTGKLDKLTVELKDLQLASKDQQPPGGESWRPPTNNHASGISTKWQIVPSIALSDYRNLLKKAAGPPDKREVSSSTLPRPMSPSDKFTSDRARAGHQCSRYRETRVPAYSARNPAGGDSGTEDLSRQMASVRCRLQLGARQSPISTLLIVTDVAETVLRALYFGDRDDRLRRVLRMHYGACC